MILADINELTTIDSTIHSLHEKLTELYERRREIILPSEQPIETTTKIEAIEPIINLETIDLSLDDTSTLSI